MKKCWKREKKEETIAEEGFEGNEVRKKAITLQICGLSK